MKAIFFILFILFTLNINAQHLGFALDGEVAIGGVGHYPFAPGIFALADYEIFTDVYAEVRGGAILTKSNFEGWELGLNTYYSINNWLHLLAGINYHKNYAQTFKYKDAINSTAADVIFYGFGVDVHLGGEAWLETQYYRAFKYKIWTYSFYRSYPQQELYIGKIKGMYRLGFKFAFEI